MRKIRVSIPSRQARSLTIFAGRLSSRAGCGAARAALLGFADWNDTINLPSGSSSLLATNLYGAGLIALIELCEYLKQDDLAWPPLLITRK